MSDQSVRDQLALYVEGVTPAQLPPFSGVAVRRRRQRARRVLAAGTTVVVVVALVLGGMMLSRSSGSSETGQTASRLVGTTWRLATVTSKGDTWTAPEDSTWSITFASGTFTGNDGCNTVSGRVSYGPDTVALLDATSTAIGCVATDLDRPTHAFASFEAHAAQVAVSAGGLTLTLPDAVLTLVRKGSTVDGLAARLIGPRWMLRSASVDGKDVPKADDFGASISFAADSFKADDGCNTSTGTVAYQDGAVQLSQGPQTAADCPEDHAVRQAQRYAGRLDVTVHGTVLTLSGGSHVLVFDQQGHAPFASQLVGTSWRLESWSLNGNPQKIAAGSGPGMAFMDGVDRYATAKDGCNTHTWNARYDGASVTLVGGTETRASCPGARGALGDAYERLGGKQLSVTVTTDRLIVSGVGVVLDLTSTAASATAPSPTPSSEPTVQALQATVWQLLTVDGPGAGSTGHWSVPSGAASVAFGDLVWDANDGCNDHSGSLLYGPTSSAGTTLSMAPGSSSAVGCTGGLVGRVEKLENTDLPRSVTVVVAGSRLTMHSGQDVLTFVPAVERPRQELATVRGRDRQSLLTEALQTWSWHVQSWTLDGTTTSGSSDTLVFNNANAVSSGCGAMVAGVSYRGDSVAFTAGPNPAVACGAPTPQNAFVALFSGGAVVSISGTTLTLTGNDVAMTFTAGASRYPQ